jgi:sulfopyruvate decarboxylase TPP-binding subunit
MIVTSQGGRGAMLVYDCSRRYGRCNQETMRMSWSETFLTTLKNNNVGLVTYVPDNVLTPLIKGAVDDPFFRSIVATREDEALGIIAGAWMAGMHGIVMMQTSGFAVIPNALASLIVPSQIPAILVVSERGTLGEFNIGQVLVSRVLRPTLDALAVAHHTLTDEVTMPFIVDRSIKQAVATQSPVVFILSPLLTGGKTFSK